MEKEKSSNTLLRWILSIIIGISFVLELFPNILDWNRNDIWIMGMPKSLFCIILFPSIIMLCLVGIYIMDKKETDQKRLLRKNQAKGGM